MPYVTVSKVLKVVAFSTLDGWSEWHLASGEVIAASPQLTAQVPPERSAKYGYYLETDDGQETWTPLKPTLGTL